MIRAMLNLKCEDGHYHYSPTPKLFDGHICFRSTTVNSKQRRCMKKLAITKSPVQIVHDVR